MSLKSNTEIMQELLSQANSLPTYDEAYNEGYNKGVAEVEAQNAEILTDCNTQLESKGVEGADSLEQVPERIAEIKAAGIDILSYAKNIPDFTTAEFPDGTNITINIPRWDTDNIGSWMDTKGVKSLKLICGTPKRQLALSTTFAGSTIEVLDLTEFQRSLKYIKSAFMRCYSLHSILGELDCYTCTFNGYEFYQCTALEEIRIKAGTINKSIAFAQSNKLSDASIQSIIDGLADLTGATTQTVTFHADVGNKLTQAQKDTITAKNWTLAY